jgi:hypothetical protein
MSPPSNVPAVILSAFKVEVDCSAESAVVPCADVDAHEAAVLASLAFVDAITACAVTNDSVASVLESPASLLPLTITINSP